MRPAQTFYVLSRPDGSVERYFHIAQMARRLSRLAGGDPIAVNPVRVASRAGVIEHSVAVSAVPVHGALEYLGHVSRPETPELRVRMSAALMQVPNLQVVPTAARAAA